MRKSWKLVSHWANIPISYIHFLNCTLQGDMEKIEKAEDDYFNNKSTDTLQDVGKGMFLLYSLLCENL